VTLEQLVPKANPCRDQRVSVKQRRPLQRVQRNRKWYKRKERKHEIKKCAATVTWLKVSTNLADFFTKYVDKTTHQEMTKTFMVTLDMNSREGVLDVKGKVPTKMGD
jgi:hypothetical protein